mmetsp:Transcript_37763/g.100282  ORF Transcript_37763/g.100282 Transcript_37763/m.100282 type:complete len:86 (+) Transcript_37763:770-1027(+)
MRPASSMSSTFIDRQDGRPGPSSTTNPLEPREVYFFLPSALLIIVHWHVQPEAIFNGRGSRVGGTFGPRADEDAALPSMGRRIRR